MKLKDKYVEIKKDYTDSLVLIKSGLFYISYDNDAMILNHIFNYNIQGNKVGFPTTIKNKITNDLKKLSISYYIYDEINDEYNKDNENKYYRYLIESQKKSEKRYLLDSLFTRIELLINVDESNYDKIKKFIDTL